MICTTCSISSAQAGVIYMLYDILNDNSQTRLAYLANPAVHRITKLRHEGRQSVSICDAQGMKPNSSNAGSFCGYRNIQMLISHLILATEIDPIRLTRSTTGSLKWKPKRRIKFPTGLWRSTSCRSILKRTQLQLKKILAKASSQSSAPFEVRLRFKTVRWQSSQ